MNKNFVKKSEKIKTYYKEQLLEQINRISDYSITVVSAPRGFGKTTAIKANINSEAVVRWVNVNSDSKELFWMDLLDTFSSTLKDNENLLNLEFPQDEKHVVAIKRVFRQLAFNEDTFIIIDNYSLVADKYMDLLLSVMYNSLPANLHLVIVTNEITSDAIINLINSDEILYIDKSLLEFSIEDIKKLFEINEVSLTNEELEDVYNSTDGWISAIYLMLIDYKETGKINASSTVEGLINNVLWLRLNDKQKQDFVLLSKLKQVSFNEAELILGASLPKTVFEKIMNDDFLFKYDEGKRRYSMHTLFQIFLSNQYETLTAETKKMIIIKTGKVHEARGDIFDAYKCYYEAKEWKEIYSSVPDFSRLYPYINSVNKSFFLALIKDCPAEISNSYYYFPIIMCFVLFLYNEKDLLLDYLMNIVYTIEEDENLKDHERKLLLGTVYYVRGYTEFNNIPVMSQFYQKAIIYATNPISNLTAKVPFSYSCPSILHLYHIEGESVDKEIEELNECMPNYYKLSEGHGKGSEALMKAEVLFNRGDFEGAEVLCHKSLYMADSRDQVSITIASIFLLCKINIVTGDMENFATNYELLRKKIKHENAPIDLSFINMVEMCEGFINSVLDDKEGIAKWLTSWETIETHLNVATISFANIIYGKWLLLNEEYQKFLGISGQFLGVASVYSNGLPKIYTYIQLAIAHQALENDEKAEKMFRMALDLAVINDFIMPFVENAAYIEKLLDKVSLENKYRNFVKKINAIHKKTAITVKNYKKNQAKDSSFGLTARELECAKLAAQRLSNKEIAEKLFIAESTVKSNLKIIFNKLNVHSRAELSNYF